LIRRCIDARHKRHTTSLTNTLNDLPRPDRKSSITLWVDLHPHAQTRIEDAQATSSLIIERARGRKLSNNGRTFVQHSGDSANVCVLTDGVEDYLLADLEVTSSRRFGQHPHAGRQSPY
jgi:hypothetical protein